MGARALLGDARAAPPGGARDDARVQVRGEAPRLFLPGAQHGGGGDDEDRRRLRIGVAQGVDRAQQLHGLAQAHVVGQHAAQPGPGARRQPVVPRPLVGAQPCGEGGRDGQARAGGAVGPVQEEADGPSPPLAGADVVRGLGERPPQPGLGGADARGARIGVREHRRLGQQRPQALDALPVQGDPRPVDQDVVLAPGQGGQDVLHGDGGPRDRDLQAQAEPVRAGVVDHRGDPHAVVVHSDAAHLVGDVPHDAGVGQGPHGRVQEGGCPPRGYPRRGGHRPPQPVLTERGAQGVDPLRARGEAGVRGHGPGQGDARGGGAEVVLRPPPHRHAVPALEANGGDDGRAGVLHVGEGGVEGDHVGAPAQPGQPRGAELREVRHGHVHGAALGQGVQQGHAVDPGQGRAALRDEQPGFDRDPGKALDAVAVAGHSPQCQGIRPQGGVQVDVPGRVLELERREGVHSRP